MHASGTEEQLLQPLDRRLKDLFRGGVRFPIRPQSWDRLGHLNVAFKAEGSPHRAVAFPQSPVGGFVATRLGEEGTQPQHRELSRF